MSIVVVKVPSEDYNLKYCCDGMSYVQMMGDRFHPNTQRIVDSILVLCDLLVHFDKVH